MPNEMEANQIIVRLSWVPATDRVMVTTDHYEGLTHVGTLRGEYDCRHGEEGFGALMQDQLQTWLLRCREIRLGV